jgi:anti-anti-sigma factor
MNTVTPDGSRTLDAAKMLDIYTAPSLLAAVRSAMDDPGDVVIDLGNAPWMHSAAVQVLVTAVRAAHAGGRSLRLTGISPEMETMWHSAGLNAVLGMPEADREPD